MKLPRRPPWTIAPVDRAAPWDGWDRRALIAATAIAAWVFACKLKSFFDLGFTSDLFVQTQLARGWLEGRFLTDNCYGPHLGIHTYFFLNVLGLLAKPLGAPGLLLALAAAVGACVLLAHRILRLLGVDGRLALAGGVALVLLPVSVWVFSDPMGFHTDLMIPPLGLGLFYALLRRKLVASLVMTLLVCSVKEDAPIIVGVLAAMVLLETRLSDRGWHRPALASLGMGLALFPILMLIKQRQPHSPFEVNHFALLTGATGEAVHGAGSLLAFIGRRLFGWIAFSLKEGWPLLFLASTLGLLVLRPWFAPLGFLTTGVAWLMADVAGHSDQGLVWSDRAIDATLFCWCVILLGAASLLRWASASDAARRRSIARAAIGVLLASLIGQLVFTRRAWDPLDLAPFQPSPYTVAERKQANELFAIYRRDGRPDEPVAASPSLFRYAHDRDLYWLDRLRGRPRPIWILQDGEWPFTDFGLRAEDYTIVGRNGRFTLLKRN
jgi:hypothetical protein